MSDSPPSAIDLMEISAIFSAVSGTLWEPGDLAGFSLSDLILSRIL